MRISPIGVLDNQLIAAIRLRWFSTLRLRAGTSISLLVLRLRYKNKHLNNHFPYVKVHMTPDPVSFARVQQQTELDPTQQALCEASDCRRTTPGALAGVQLDVLA